MLTSSVWDDGAINRLAVEGDALHTLLTAVRMDRDLIFCLTELTGYHIVGGCLWQTGIDADTIVVGFDTEDKLSMRIPS